MKVRAPGKIVLAGEYAVLLDGEPSVVAAVDRYVHVESVPADRAELVGVWRDGDEVPDGAKFVAGSLTAFGKPPRKIMTSDELHDGEHKLGLGGSAAITVATCQALGAEKGLAREHIWAAADRVHRKMQGGKGSGADVAASVHGGVGVYTRSPRAWRAVEVPAELRLVLAWTGRSERTAPRLERWNAWTIRNPDGVKVFAEASRGACALLEKGFQVGDFETIRGAIAGARKALAGLAEGLGLELETETLRRASDIAFDAGACGKLSGAGGGDCAIVLAWGDEGAVRVTKALDHAGIKAIPVGIDQGGVRRE